MQGNESEQPIASSAAAVLGSGDLLPVILLRLGCPTSLVRAALVCRRWYRVASSHPDFLRRFRQIHRPGVLGFYSDLAMSARAQFVPLAEAPELATAVHRAGAVDGKFVISDCRDGRLLVRSFDEPSTRGRLVLRPLDPSRGVAAVIPLPPQSQKAGFRPYLFLPEDARDDGAVFVEVFLHGRMFEAQVSTFQIQSGIWTVRTTVPMQQLPCPAVVARSVRNVLPPFHGKMYIKACSTCSRNVLLELDLVAASVSVIRLPDRVNTGNYKISCGEDWGLSLVHAHGSLLSIWHCKISGNGSHDWVLVDDAIRVREAYDRHEDVTVFVVDSRLEYVFLGLNASGVLLTMHLKSRTEKVYGEVRFPHLGIENRIVPFIMFWPHIVFPALTEGNVASQW